MVKIQDTVSLPDVTITGLRNMVLREFKRRAAVTIPDVGDANGMTNDWLKDQRLLSVKELWVNIPYPATAR
ncbi:MAG: hypothetical protein WCW53_14470 [Syntrophales bacterium]